MMEIIKKLLVRSFWFSVGAAFLWTANNIFDWVLYPVAMCKMGLVTGGVVMTIWSVPFNLFLIAAYDFLGRDLFALEAAKEAQYKNKSLFGKLLSRSRWISFVALSLYDPVPAVLYARAGHGKFNGMTSGRDWGMFILATLIANLGWIALITFGLTAIGSVDQEFAELMSVIGLGHVIETTCVPLL